ncbi:hypothetical protein FGSG_06491 [Fusarium graminearum PH-1]|uniref:Chromosome 4, complete genome n=1 Tax=Gibberella zeae (strain ATCC MYA-4620 / CBS 123657 / FGSC 9075 / NRRL 31084 / PH-1) TaxID=229533 RepID=I1RQY9_GIBZE|nr:hypothetical protein FGSG_06491 [Fusarium graminearum PH-1]ESU12591.1 hypothetical protein FGSG_06491 [Fusarium graminearum PH-1]CEF85348.1 unnamed protein product [Fusarium graminearum]|eukprot:XP_011326098.1 hypothetical protein FGSG_06491 [Fusarium graminearum PH-1]
MLYYMSHHVYIIYRSDSHVLFNSMERSTRGMELALPTKTREKHRNQKPTSFDEEIPAFEANFLDDELALAEATLISNRISRLNMASLASLSSEAFHADVSPPLDPAFFADEKFLSEDLNDSDTSIVEISSDSDSDASSTEDSDDEDSSAELPDKLEALLSYYPCVKVTTEKDV